MIKRSSKGLQIHIALISLAAIGFGLLASWLTSIVFRPVESNGSLTILIIWLLFVIGWGLGAAKLWLDWRKKYYEIAEDALIVHHKMGWFGSTQTVYRYESIISIRMTQGYFGKQFGYGDVHLSIPKLEHDVVMNDIEHPLEQLAEVQRRIGQRSSDTHSLVN